MATQVVPSCAFAGVRRGCFCSWPRQDARLATRRSRIFSSPGPESVLPRRAEPVPKALCSRQMKDPAPQPIHRKDYQPPALLIDAVDLHFDLQESHTTVRATMAIRRNGAHDRPLVLDGERLELVSLEVDGKGHAAYTVTDDHLTLEQVPAEFELRTEVRIKPHENTELSGLYRSGDTYCTQCEAQGFRRITYFLDRPDVMARYRTTIVAEQTKYPVMLSNGNAVDRAELAGGRHSVTWEDPFPKPSYLFALVAADLACKAGTFTTRSGREVKLEIWVEHQNLGACDHALTSLQKSMQWDE